MIEDITEDIRNSGVRVNGGWVKCHKESVVNIHPSVIWGGGLSVNAPGCNVAIDKGVKILSGMWTLHAVNCSLLVGNNTTMVDSTIFLHETSSIVIGSDCMFSMQTFLSTSDIHAIYDKKSGLIVNKGADIVVGNHVWLGLRAMVLHGTKIGDGSVVGAGALVKGDYSEGDCVLAGSPAKIIRRDIRWERRLPEESGHFRL